MKRFTIMTTLTLASAIASSAAAVALAKRNVELKRQLEAWLTINSDLIWRLKLAQARNRNLNLRRRNQSLRMRTSDSKV